MALDDAYHPSNNTEKEKGLQSGHYEFSGLLTLALPATPVARSCLVLVGYPPVRRATSDNGVKVNHTHKRSKTTQIRSL